MRVGTRQQLRNASNRVWNAWNNTDANYLRNQESLIEDRLVALQRPKTTSSRAWCSYDDKRTALRYKLCICQGKV